MFVLKVGTVTVPPAWLPEANGTSITGYSPDAMSNAKP